VYGIIPVYDPRVRADYGFICCVGDAAGQVKATTGGGVVLGGVAASLVAREDYERAWRDAIGRELYFHLLLRKIVDRVSLKNQNLLFDIFESSVSALEEGGDMDYASKIVLSLMFSPKFVASVIFRTPQILLSLL
jgi:flavin-dependent dehydrogenase